MIQVQFVLDFQSGENKIMLNILAREDVNDLERQMASYIQDLHVGIFEMIEKQMPDEIEITMID